MAAALSLNGIRVLSAIVLVPWSGVWTADLDLDPEDVSQVPASGPAALTIGAAPAPVVTLQGTIDPRYSGSFVASARVRLVAGGGGWDKSVPPDSWNADGGTLSSVVYAKTAALVGETVNVPAPVNLGPLVERIAGPARRILGDQPWYVDFAGVTQIAARPPATADASLELLNWYPREQRAELACDTLVLPGTTLSDPRLNGAAPVVRDVEHVFGKNGMRANAWCSSTAVSRMSGTLKNLVRELAGAAHLRVYRYRYVLPRGNRLSIQAVTPGAPSIDPIPEGTGMSGVLAKLSPGTILYIAFVNGDPTDPIVLGYDPGATPLEVDVAGGSDFVALATLVHTELQKIAACFASFVPGSGGANFPVLSLYGGPDVPVGSVAASKVKAT